MRILQRIQHFVRASIRNRLAVILIGVIIIPLFVSVYLSFVMFQQVQVKDCVRNNTNLLLQASKRMDDYFLTLTRTTSAIRDDTILSDVLNNFDEDKKLYTKKLRALTNYFFQEKNTHTLLFYYPMTQELFVLSNGSFNLINNAGKIEDQDWYQTVLSTNDLLIEPSHRLTGYDPRFHIDDSASVVTLSQALRSTLNSRPYAVVSVSFRLTFFQELCRELLLYDQESIGCSNGQGQPYWNTHTERTLEPELLRRINDAGLPNGNLIFRDGNGVEQLLIYMRSSSNNLLYKCVPMHDVYQQASQSRNINLITMLITIGFLFGAILVVSGRLTRPIKELESAMTRASTGDLKAFTHTSRMGDDEIAQISKEYNHMLRRIDTLIVEKYEMQLLHRSTLLKALQAQINPHFLINTLQSIASDALEQNNMPMYLAICRLARMLRYSVKSAGYRVTLADEFQNAQDYLELQKARYGERLRCELILPDELRNNAVPKLFLQPIIENAISHGLEPCARNGKLIVRAWADGGRTCVEVADSGIGIQPEALEQLRRELQAFSEDDVESGRIGLGNIYRRIRLLMGEHSQLLISSEPDRGTTVTAVFDTAHIEDFQDG